MNDSECFIPKAKFVNSFLGMEELADEFQDVFDYLFVKRTSKVAFSFTDKVYKKDVFAERACAGSASQLCETEILRSMFQAYLKNLPSHWNQPKDRVRRASLLTWLATKIDISNARLLTLTQEITDFIFKIVEGEENVGLMYIERFFEYLPSLKSLDFWKKNAPKYPMCDDTRNRRQSRCVFSEILSTFTKYANFRQNKVKSKLVLTSTKWDVYLKLLKWNTMKDASTEATLTIKASLSELKQDLKNFVGTNIGERFNALAKGMKKMATFGRKIAIADSEFIISKLDLFRQRVDKYMATIQRNLVPVIAKAFEKAIVDVGLKAGRVLLAGIGMFNPIKHLIGDTDLNEVLDRADDLAKASIDVLKAKKLQDTYWKAIGMSKEVGIYFESNKRYLDYVAKITLEFVKKTDKDFEEGNFEDKSGEFLELYSGYDPTVKRGKIVQFGVLLESLADQACDLVFEDLSVGSATYAGQVVSRGDCITLPSDIAGLSEVYAELYDYQFDLMDALAESVKENLAYATANELSKEFERVDLDINDATALSVFSMKTFLVNRMYRMKAVFNYCNYLQYLNGGKQTDLCKEAMAKLDDASVDKLIAFDKSGLLTCPLIPRIVYLPTTRKTDDDTDEAFIDIKALYSGRPSVFRIPDAYWLAQNKWINPADVTNHIYQLHDMRIFLPDSADHDRLVRTKVTSASKTTKFYPGEDAERFYLADQRVNEFVFGYTDDAHYTNCGTTNIRPNPSSVCRQKLEEDITTDICVKTTTASKPLQPSVFSAWVIELETNGKKGVSKNVNFTTPVYLAAEITICAKKVEMACDVKIHGKCKDAKQEARARRNRGRCCPPKDDLDQYWDREKKNVRGRLGSCVACPKGSKRWRTGTFCHNDSTKLQK